MKLYVPRVGSGLRLLSDWTFNVIQESRNDSLLKILKMVTGTENYWQSYGKKVGTLTIPAGTELFVDRVYIRRSNKAETENDYDSMTFRVKSGGLEGLGQGKRFFAKIADCNTMDVEPIDFSTLKKERKTLTASQLRDRSGALYRALSQQQHVRDYVFGLFGSKMDQVVALATEEFFRENVLNDGWSKHWAEERRAGSIFGRSHTGITFETVIAKLNPAEVQAYRQLASARWGEQVHLEASLNGKYLPSDSPDKTSQKGKVRIKVRGKPDALWELDCELTFKAPSEPNGGHPVKLVILSGDSVSTLKFSDVRGLVTIE